ncbi:hypothetical protein Tco_1220938 [Tanacetum coccineum]
MVAYLEKSMENVDFDEIVDFLNASPIRYALTVSPTIYMSYIEQFWSTTKIKTVNNERQIRAKVDGKTIVISESSVRRDLQFNDDDCIACLTNTEIFENLQLMGYENLTDKLTFYKSYFSPQWKYLIHTILQCLSSKSTAWNKFGTDIASAVICLAKNQKFNFSKLIFDGMLRNLDPNSKKFLMYPRFLQLFLNTQIENLEPAFNDEYVTPSHTKKVFANIRRKGKDFSGTVTPLFATMLIQPQAVEGKGSGQSSESQHTPTTASPSHVEPIPVVASSSQPKKTQKHRTTKRKATEISYSSGPTTLVADETVYRRGENGTGSGSGPRRQDTILGDRPAQTRLKKRVQKLEKKKKSRTSQLKRRLFKVRIESSAEKSLGNQEDASKQGRNRNEIYQDERVLWFQEDSETQGRYSHDMGVNTASTPVTTASINITIVEPVTTISAPITTAGVSVSTVEPSTPPTTTTLLEDEDLTIAQTLVKMRSEKSKVKSKEKSKEKGVSSETAIRSTRGVIIQEAKELQAELEEEKERIARQREEEANLISWDNTQAIMEADYELAQRLQAEEQGELTIEERSKLFVELMDKRKNQLKNKSFEEIQMLFDKTMKWVDLFVPMDSEVVEGSKNQAERSKKRTLKELDEESVKRQKLEDDAEKAELKACLEIVPKDDEVISVESLATKYSIIDWKTHILAEDKMYYEIIRADGSAKFYKIFTAMLNEFDRQEVLDLYRLVKERFKISSPEGYDRLHWGDLITLLEPSEEDEVWKAQQDYTLIS